MTVLSTRSFRTEKGLGRLTLQGESLDEFESKIASQIMENEHARIFDLQVMFKCDVSAIERTLSKLGSVTIDLDLQDVEAIIPVLSHIKVLDGVIFYEYSEEFLMLFKGKEPDLGSHLAPQGSFF